MAINLSITLVQQSSKPDSRLYGKMYTVLSATKMCSSS